MLNVGGVHDGVDQQALRIEENVPLLALNLFSRIVTRRIDRRPPFSALLTLWLSMTAAVRLRSRPSPSRHFTQSIWWLRTGLPSHRPNYKDALAVARGGRA